jgi:hypothetical protein
MNSANVISVDNFRELYERFGPMVLRRCRYLLRDEDTALDAMQDVFVRVLERRERMTEVCSSLFFYCSHLGVPEPDTGRPGAPFPAD